MVTTDIFARLSEICPVTGTVRIAGRAAAYWADAPQVAQIIAFVFGDLAQVTSGADDGGPAGPGCDWKVYFAAMRADLEALLPEEAMALAEPGVVIKRWKGDHEAVRLDLGGGVSVIRHEEPFRGLTLFDAGARRVAYLRRDAAANVPHVEHLLKYPIRFCLREAGFSEIHAATVSYAGHGIALIGYRKSGKTTLAMHILAAGGRMVGSDLALIRSEREGHLQMIAVPHMTRIAPPTIEDNPYLSKRIHDVRNGDGDYLAGSVFNDGKEEIYYPVFRRLFAREVGLAESATDLLVMPQFDPECRSSEIARLTEDEARMVVVDRLINDQPLPEWLPFRPFEEMAAQVEASAARFIESLPPLYRIRMGPSHSKPIGAIDRILTEL